MVIDFPATKIIISGDLNCDLLKHDNGRGGGGGGGGAFDGIFVGFFSVSMR